VDRAGTPYRDPPGQVLRTQLVAPPPQPHASGRPVARRVPPGWLTLVAETLTTAEIGERLKISPRAVEAHLRTRHRTIDCAPARYAVEHGESLLVTLRDHLTDRGNPSTGQRSEVTPLSPGR
jgi:hypothetical protein